jgi:hypothetical protein
MLGYPCSPKFREEEFSPHGSQVSIPRMSTRGALRCHQADRDRHDIRRGSPSIFRHGEGRCRGAGQEARFAVDSLVISADLELGPAYTTLDKQWMPSQWLGVQHLPVNCVVSLAIRKCARRPSCLVSMFKHTQNPTTIEILQPCQRRTHASLFDNHTHNTTGIREISLYVISLPAAKCQKLRIKETIHGPA